MVESLTANEIEDQIGLRKVRFQQVIADIRAVLRTDIESFVVREAKRAFLAKPDVAGKMSQEQVAKLKRGSVDLGKSSAARIDKELENVELWMSTGSDPANTRDLVGAARVWEKVSSVEADLARLLGEFGLGEAQPTSYKLPAYFVGGLYMPSLAEHYWRIVQETRELEEQKKKLTENAEREVLQAKWDEIA
ncbi:MAG: hypothetical protein U1F43_36510 [Myxococcota bacterium]